MTLPPDEESSRKTTGDGEQNAAPSSDDSPAVSSTELSPIVTRRRLLAAGGASAGVLAGGTGYVLRELQPASETLDAPEDFPTLSTRGAFDEDGGVRTDREPIVAEQSGDWSGIGADAALVLFVHGWTTEHESAQNQAYTTQRGLQEAGKSLPAAVFSWDSDRDWGVANAIAQHNGAALARFLAAAADDGPEIHLIGYSLGAHVSCACLQHLRRRGLMGAVSSVSLLGGAIPYDSVEETGQYGEAIAVTPTVANFHSDRDRVLGWMYRLAERTRAVGYTGARRPAETPATYTDVDVSTLVDSHGEYYHPERGCLPQLVDTVFS